MTSAFRALINANDATANQRRASGVVMGKKSTALQAANVAARTNVAASRLPLDDRTCAEQFSATVIPFSAADLAMAAHRTKAAAKGWKDASRAPSLASVINMARQIPAVRKWLSAQIEGRAGADEFSMDSPRFLAALIGAIHRLSELPGPEGDAVRKVLRGN